MNAIAMSKNAFEKLGPLAKAKLVKKYGPPLLRGVGAVAAATPGWLLLGGAVAAGVVVFKRLKRR